LGVSSRKIRLRFAPSPTGEPHLGNARTALFNWLFARKNGGDFIVRIEDTDRRRYSEGATEAILDSLKWLGLDWDEGPGVGGPNGPYFQSQRLDLYKEVAEKLISGGKAYYCYCSPERLEGVRKAQGQKKQTQQYDRYCRDIPAEKHRHLQSEISKKVIRFKVDPDGETTTKDLVRGTAVWRNDLVDDFVILKSDGYPTYHLANVVDDTYMEITHVLRAEEWLSSAPKHLMLYKSLGFDPPLFGHLPMILGSDRSKLSKRHGASSVIEYKNMGFLPEALANYLALLGWSLDDKTDVISMEQLIDSFSLERVNKSAAIFNSQKLVWLNGVYIRKMPCAALTEAIKPFLEEEISSFTESSSTLSYLTKIVPLIQERLKTLKDAPDLAGFFFQDKRVYAFEELVQKNMDKRATMRVLKQSLEVIQSVDEFEADVLEERLRTLATELSLSARQLLGVLRVAITGKQSAPPLFETMEILGRDRCCHFVSDAMGRFLG